MRKRKLYHLLALMSTSDWERLSVFLRSPFFNTNPTLIAFWELWLNQILKAEKDVNPSPGEFVAGSPIKEHRIDALCRDLMALVRKFLSVRSLEDSPQLQPLLFAKAVLERDPGLKDAPRFLPQVEKELGRQPDSPEQQLSILYFEAMKIRSRTLARKANDDWLSEFGRLHSLLEGFAQTKGLEWSCGAVNAVQIFRGEKELPTRGFYSAYLEESSPDKEALLPQLYRLSLKLLLGAAEAETFPRIISILEHHREEIAPDVRNDIFTYTLNFCIRKINQGDEDYLHHAFDLYRLLLQSGDLLIEGKISPQQYKNLVSLACRVEKLDWAFEFMQDYAPLLSDDHEGLALSYNRAVLHFHESSFAEAIRQFREVIQTAAHDIFYGLDARIYLWKSYFEFREHLLPDQVDDMYRLYDSLRQYVDRSTRISERHQNQYRNLIRLFKGFLQTLENPDPDKRLRRLRSLRKKLESKDVANITWFSQKVDEALLRELS